MDITFLGTGSAFNHINGNTAAFLEFNGTNMLLDCGYDVVQHFEKKYGNISKIDNIWISHMHADHCGSLEEIAFKNKFMNGGKKTNLIIHESIYDDLIAWLELTLKWSINGFVRADQYFNIHKISDQQYNYFEINETGFTMVKTEHIGAQPAYYLAGDKFIYTADSKFVQWSKFNLDHIQYIFQDTQLERYGNDVHTTLPELLTLPQEIRNKIWCMHYGANIKEYKTKIEDAGMHIVEKYQAISL